MKKDILVIGSTNVDFLIRADRLPSFGETVTGGTFMQNFGGKGANQAVGAARAGGNVTFVTCLGDDLYAGELLDSFAADGINTGFVQRDSSTATGSALIMLDNNGNNYISVAPGANSRLLPEHVDRAADILKNTGMIVLQMEIPFSTNAHVFRLARKHGRKVLFNLAPAGPFDHSVLKDTYAFIVNEVEASGVTGLNTGTDAEIVAAASRLLEMGPSVAVITLGSRGCYIASPEYRQFIPAFKVKAVDTTAAGDVYCGSLAVALTEGKPLPEAVKFASAASAISVTRMGAQPSAPARDEIEEFLKQNTL
jgi:ribokinase